jgi:hypothetical protein
MPDTILEGDHPRIISAKFGWDWLNSFRGEDFFQISSPLFLFLAWWPSWLEVGITEHKFGRGPSQDHSTKVWLQLAQWFLRRRLKCEMLTDGRQTTRWANQRLPGACNRSPGSKLLSITTQLHCGGHLGGRAQLPDTILQEDHPMTIPSKFGFNWATGSRQDGFYVNFP